MRAAKELAGWALLLVGLYLALISSIDQWEAIVAVGVGILAAATGPLVRVAEHASWRPRLAWCRWLVAVPTTAVRDTATLVAVVWRRLVLRQDVRGHFRRLSAPLGGNNAQARARRALTAAAISVTPGTYVVDIDTNDGTVLIHELGRPGGRVEGEVTR